MWKNSYLLTELDEVYLRELEGYKSRVFDIFSRPLRGEEHDETKVESCRRIGDRMTWKISLDTAGVKESSTPDMVLQQSGFEMIRGKWETQPETLQMSAPLLKSLALKYQYTIPRDGFRTFLSARLEELSAKQLLRLPKKFRPPQLRVGRTLRQTPDLWKYVGHEALRRGEAWKYYDNKIQRWFNEYAELELKRVAELELKRADGKLEAEDGELKMILIELRPILILLGLVVVISGLIWGFKVFLSTLVNF